MNILSTVNLLSGLSFILFICLTRFTASSPSGFLPLDPSHLMSLTDWTFMNSAVIKMLEQTVFKGVAVITFWVQYRERIVAIILVIILARYPIVNRTSQIIVVLSRFTYRKSIRTIFNQLSRSAKVETCKNEGLKKWFWRSCQRPIDKGLLLNCPGLP